MANYGTDASSFVAGTGHVVANPETGTWRGLPTTWRFTEGNRAMDLAAWFIDR